MHLTFKLTAVDMVEDLGSSIFSPCGDAIRLPKLLIIMRGLPLHYYAVVQGIFPYL